MAETHNWMASRSDRSDRFPLETQSRGRQLTADEQTFADALEAIFKDGTHDMDAVADALSKAGVKAPISGKSEWTQESLQDELTAINSSLDAAHEENGYGA